MTEDVTRQNFLIQLFRYSALNILGSLGYSIYIFADTFFMARGLGPNGLTALNLILPGCSLIMALAMMFGVGASTRFAILQGQKKYKEASEVFSVTIKAALFVGLIFLLIGLLLSEVIVKALGADEIILPLSATYLRTFLFFSPAFIANGVMTSFVRCDGSPRLAMVAMLMGSGVNTVLDVVFIFGLKWGMFGAAFSSGLAPIVSLAILLLHRTKGKNTFHFMKARSGISTLLRISALGTSTFISEISSGIIMLVFNFVILDISGNLGVAAYGIVANLALIAAAVFNGLTNGVQPLISRAYGEGKHKNIRQGFLFLMLGALALGLLFYASGLLFPTEIARIFDSEGNAQLVSMGAYGIILYFLAFLFMGLNIAVIGYLTSKEQAPKAFVISILRGGVIIIPMVIVMARVWGMTGVWLAAPVTEFITFVVAAIILLWPKWMKKQNKLVEREDLFWD